MEIERIIGKLEEMGRATEQRLLRIEVKIDDLLAFKWKALGVAAFMAFAATLLVEIFNRRG